MSVVLYIQHAERIRSIVLSSVAYSAVIYFAHYLIKGTNFGKTFSNIKCVTMY